MFGKLLLLFIAIPVIELYLFMTLGDKIGVPRTLGIIVATAFLGAWLTKKQGARAMAKLQLAMAEGRMPHNEVLDGVMILIAGVVLLTPGFLTDAIGFALLVPPVRAVVRKALGSALKGRVQIVTPGGAASPGPSRRNDDDVIEAEVEIVED
ncbi:MAG: UPF0716 protein FxsA [Verrucomicrobiales bacterium]|jgi:UPF0716 protein FxsA